MSTSLNIKVVHGDETSTVGNRMYYRGSLLCGVSFPMDSYGYICVCGEQYRPVEAEEGSPYCENVEPFRSIQKEDYSPWTYQEDGLYVVIEEFAPQGIQAFIEAACNIVLHYWLTDFWCIPQARDFAINASSRSYDVMRYKLSQNERWRRRGEILYPNFAPITIERSEVQTYCESLIRGLVERKHLLLDESCNMLRAQNEKAVEALGAAMFALNTYRPRVEKPLPSDQALLCETYQ